MTAGLQKFENISNDAASAPKELVIIFRCRIVIKLRKNTVQLPSGSGCCLAGRELFVSAHLVDVLLVITHEEYALPVSGGVVQAGVTFYRAPHPCAVILPQIADSHCCSFCQ